MSDYERENIIEHQIHDRDELDHIQASVQGMGDEFCPRCGKFIGTVNPKTGYVDYIEGCDQVMEYNGDTEMVCGECWDKAEAQAQAAIDEGR